MTLTGKRERVAVPDDGTHRDDGSDTETGTGRGADTGMDATPLRHRTLAVLVLTALLATGGGLLAAADRAEHAPAARNRALADAEATRRVVGDISNALTAVFSYTPDDLPATGQRAREVLRGRAAKDYQALYTRLERQVRRQKLTLTTQVVRAAVRELSGERAELLVFLDQHAQRASADVTTAAAQLSVTARLYAGRWTITEIKAR